MNKTILRQYARLAVRKGINVQKGQGVQIFAPAQQHEFAAMCAREAYLAGAAWVLMEWSCQETAAYSYKYQTLEQLSTMEKWRIEKLNYLADNLPCRLHILSDDPDGFNGIDSGKMAKAQAALYPYIEPYQKAIDNRHQWCIVGAPCPAWAKKVFPQMKKQAAVNALWEAILTSARAYENPEAAWDEHNAVLFERCEKLNKLELESLHITSGLGTDLTIGLMPKGTWLGGGEYTKQGVFYNPNMPTEEIFTTPRAGAAQGVAVASKPLSYQGQLIENFSLTFKDGSVTKHSARKGDEILEQLLTSDDGASRLGEAALVPVSSPVNKTGLLFYNTLYDENAACHLALGRGFDNTVKDYSKYSYDQLTDMGVNRSMLHIDFMIGTQDMRITGSGKSGKTMLFESGEWVI